MDAVGDGMRVPPGLCGTCVHTRTIESSRGSTFVLCQLSFSDPRFARYPVLPVVACPGWKLLPAAGNGETRRQDPHV
jgi:hypothetical protein